MIPPSANDLQVRKFRKRFQLLDTHDKGVLEPEDYEVIGHRFQRIFGLAAGSPPAVEIAATYRDLYFRLLRACDINGDKVIDEHRFIVVSTWSLLGRPDGFDRALLGALRSIMDVCGLTPESALDEQVFGDLLAAEGALPADIEVARSRLLAPAQTFTFTDLIQASREFYCSPDPASPGNWLLGAF